MGFGELATQFGLPIALLIFALILGARRVWVWGAELVESEARAVVARADCEKRLEEQRLSHARREAELAATSEKWQGLFLTQSDSMRALVAAIEASMKNGKS